MIFFSFAPQLIVCVLAIIPTMALQLQDLLDDKYLAFDGMYDL